MYSQYEMQRVYPNMFDHDDCLTACQHRDGLSDEELTALNIVAGAAVCGNFVERRFIDAAARAITRIKKLAV